MRKKPADKNRRLLIIDDNQAIHDDFRKILSPATTTTIEALDATAAALYGHAPASDLQTQFEVDSAYQGQEGLLMVQKALAAGRPYAMAFVDVRMPPGWDGVETTQRIWAVDPDIQIVICTAYSDYSWDEMFDKLGRRDGLLILKKPFDAVEAAQLANSLTEKWWLHVESLGKMEELESRVAERTRELQQTNQALQKEATGHQRAAEALREAETKYRGLFENAIEGIYQSTPDGRFLAANVALARMYGYEHPEDMMRDISDIQSQVYVDPAMRERFKQEIASTGVVHCLEYQVRRRDGTTLWISESARAVSGPDGAVLHYEGLIEDINKRKKAEQTLHRLRAQHSMILNSVGEGVHGIDSDGRIIFENPASAAMLGHEIADLIGRPAHSSMHHTRPDGSPYPQDECPIYATMKDGQIRHVRDEVFWRKDGTSFPVEYTSAPLRDENSVITGVTVVFNDITARKQLEARMIQSQKMETVGKLAGGVAHEFNSILTAIIGQCELLLSDLPPGGASAKSATEINQAANRAATLTRQLLAYGRKQFLQPEFIELNRLIAGMDSVFRLLMGPDVDIRIVPAPGLHAVKADAGQIEQVIMNIAINARDAMPTGGKLTLETANVSFDQESVDRYPELKAGDYVMLAITDSGTGMSEEVKARLFEPFFTTKGVGQGTGLGLSTCYGIIKQSGGHISVYSEPGRGTSFKIYLPQSAQQPKGPVERAASPVLPRGTETILLVEDDNALREMAGTLLTRLGYKVWAAANGVEALNLKQHRNVGHVDLLFTDVVMPHMSGKELAEQVQTLYPRTRILFTTAYTENAAIHQGVLDPGVSLLPKPYTPSALARKVREVLDQPSVPKPETIRTTST
jgi:PAS domain S-box-containing protein